MSSSQSTLDQRAATDAGRNLAHRGQRVAAGAGAGSSREALAPDGGAGDRGDHPGQRHLRLVEPRVPGGLDWRRRLLVLAGLVTLALLLAVGIGQLGASAGIAERVDGHVVMEPGQTLWEVAATTAPDGVDVRAQLAAIEEANDLRASEVEAWNVILLPAR